VADDQAVETLHPIVPGRELKVSTILQTRRGLWLLDGRERVAHFAFDDRRSTHAHGEALEGSWRFGSEGRWMVGRSGTAWAEDAATGAVVLRASAAQDAKSLMGFRQHLVIEHAGHVFEWQKSPWAARFTLSGDGRPILVVRGAVRRGRIEVGTPPSASTSLPLLVLFAVFLHQRVLAAIGP
jgi:hypothetical protein